MANRWGNNGNSDRLYLGGLQNHCSHKIKRHLLLGRKGMTNLDSILKSRDIILPTKFHLIKAMVFPVVMYGCESWTIKKATDAPAAKSLQMCPTLHDPMDSSPPGSSLHRILKARILEWVVISFSKRKLSTKELMLLNCGIREDSWESLGLQGDPASQSSRKSVLNIHWKDWCWSWSSNTLATWCKELTL